VYLLQVQEEDLAPRRVTARVVNVTLPATAGDNRPSLFVEVVSCLSVCATVWEREGRPGRGREREKEKERESRGWEREQAGGRERERGSERERRERASERASEREREKERDPY